MVRATSKKVGRGPCPSCGNVCTFRESSGGFLTHKCDACDSTGYAEQGGKAHKQRMATMVLEVTETPPQPSDPTPPTPLAKPTKKAFSLEDI